MRRITENGISFYQFEHLAGCPEIRHGCFTRIGGTSPAPFDSLNVAAGIGDASGNVRENRSRVCRCLGSRHLVFARQVHGTRVLAYARGDRSHPHPFPPATEDGDAMITDDSGRGLVIQTADCQAVLMADPVRNVVANVHCGWRGSIGNIVGRTVAVMAARFGCRPPDILAGIGPSLGPCCAEFVNYRQEIPEKLWPYMDAKNRFDFWTMSVDQLCDAGIRADAIESSGLCTRCRTDLFFSYRGNGVTGRLAAVIGLR